MEQLSNATPTRLVGERVRQLRAVRGLSAQKLADRCAALGAPEIKRQMIANLESGRRESVSLAEVFVFAQALDVPPTLLFLPMGSGQLSIAPEITLSAMRTVAWFAGLAPPHPHGFPTIGYEREAAPVRLYLSAWQQINAAQDAERAADRAKGAGDRNAHGEMLGTRDAHLEELGRVLSLMVEIGIEPPALSRRWVDLMAGRGWLKHADKIPANNEEG